MSDHEAARLLEQARAYDPVPEGTVDNVASRLASRPDRRRSYGWAFAAAFAVAGAVAFVALWPAAPPSPALPAVEVAAPAKARFISPPPPVAKAPAVTPAKKRPVPSKAPAFVAVEAPVAVAPTPPSPPPPVPALAPEGHREIVAEAPKRKKYQPRAIRELLDLDRPENVEMAAQVRRVMATMDRRAQLAQLDGMRLEQADLLVYRGALRVAYDRCDDAIVDFDRALDIDPKSARARAARALCVSDEP